MIYAIIVTSVLGFAIAALGYEHNLRAQAEEERQQAQDELRDANEEISRLKVTLANLDGVRAGTASDAMYKQFLQQYDRGEQVTVMFQQNEPHYYAK